MRFVFGGMISAIAALIANRYGPKVGGLFLAFPAIFPASATMLAQAEKTRHPGPSKKQHARMAVSADAAGAAVGSIALAAFAVFVWRMLPRHSVGVVLFVATLLWFGVAGLCWLALNFFWKAPSD